MNEPPDEPPSSNNVGSIDREPPPIGACRAHAAEGSVDRSLADRELESAGLQIDRGRLTVTWFGTPIRLTPTEMTLLQALVARPGHPLSAHELESALAVAPGRCSSNAVAVHVHRLRKKVGHDLVRTVRGRGYVLDLGLATWRGADLPVGS